MADTLIKIDLGEKLAHIYDVKTFDKNPYRVYDSVFWLKFDKENKRLSIYEPSETDIPDISSSTLVIPKETESVELTEGFRNNPISGILDFPNVTHLQPTAMRASFVNCQNLYGTVNFDMLEYVGHRALEYAFQNDTNLTGANFRNLKNIQTSGMTKAFSGCYRLKDTVNFESLEFIGQSGMYETFDMCDSITDINFKSLHTIEYAGMNHTFSNCENLGMRALFDKWGNPILDDDGNQAYSHSVTFQSLEEIYVGAEIDSSFGMWHTFENCPNLWVIHFPVELKEKYGHLLTPEVLWGAEAEGKEVMFDYVDVPEETEPDPRIAWIDCTKLTSIGNYEFSEEYTYVRKFVDDNWNPDNEDDYINPVNLSNVRSVGYFGLYRAFSHSTGLPNEISFTSLDPELVSITGTTPDKNPFFECFYECRNITSIQFPASFARFGETYLGSPSPTPYLTKAVLFGDTFENPNPATGEMENWDDIIITFES